MPAPNETLRSEDDTAGTGAAPEDDVAVGPTLRPDAGADGAGATRPLCPAAERALAEAEARRKQLAQNETAPPREIGGREGPDPARYGDWEKGGIASDF